ncbi:GAS2-like protein [Schistosoma japonicum]|uniref:GAS2-like protein n=1 Tax=Schistosoma japonicum TaxID=6182 RepID=A0A4Z2DLP2_SCHJA|nr:GAS2-like protein [Schistosoma japonicum]
MNRINGNYNRAFSLPPESISMKAENISTNDTNMQIYMPKMKSSLNKITCENVNSKTRPHFKNTYSNNCSLDWNDKQDPTDSELMLQETFNNFDIITRQFMGLSPSLSSLTTDEDSGYVRTPFGNHKLADSTCSIYNSGNTLSEDSNGAAISNKDELLLVMVEDLVDWFSKMYPNFIVDLNTDNFFERLSDGVILCHHATELHNRLATESGNIIKNNKPLKLPGLRISGVQVLLPVSSPVYQTRGLNTSSAAISFVSRNNVSNFINWCRQLGMRNSTLFESEDLVCRKNPRNVVVCLLELARLGGHVGMCIPEIVQLEVEIDKQLEMENTLPQWDKTKLSPVSVDAYSSQSSEHLSDNKYDGNASYNQNKISLNTNGNNYDGHGNDNNSQSSYYRSNRSTELRKQQQQQRQNRNLSKSQTNQSANYDNKPTKDMQDKKQKQETQRPMVDFRSLDELVRELLSQCTCKQTFPMIRIGEGRYLFGDKSTQIFVRILRNHVMVRVGGGWDTLSHFLSKYDECRKVSSSLSQNENPSAVDITNEDSLVKSAAKGLKFDQSQLSGPEAQNILEGRLNAVKKRTLSMPTQHEQHLQDDDSSRTIQMNHTLQLSDKPPVMETNKNFTETRNKLQKCIFDVPSHSEDTDEINTECLTKSQFFSELNLTTLNDEDLSSSSHLPRFKISDRYAKDAITSDEQNSLSDNQIEETTKENADVHSSQNINNKYDNTDNQSKTYNFTNSVEKSPTSDKTQRKSIITIIRSELEKSNVTPYVVNRPYLPKNTYYIDSGRIISNHDIHKEMKDKFQCQNFSRSLNSLNMNCKQVINQKNSRQVELISVLPTICDNNYNRNGHATSYKKQTKNPMKYSSEIKNTLVAADHITVKNNPTLQQLKSPYHQSSGQLNQKEVEALVFSTVKSLHHHLRNQIHQVIQIL